MNIKQLLPNFYYFWQVNKHKSVSKAAEVMGLTPGAVSHQIKSLEEKLHCSLVKRSSGQRLELTDMGERISRDCHEIFTHIENSFELFNKNGVDVENISVTAPVSFGKCLLLSFLDDMGGPVPKVDYEIFLTNDVLDITQDNVNIAIRNILNDEKLEHTTLMHVRFLAVATEEYLSYHMPINKPEDLPEDHVFIEIDSSKEWDRLGRLGVGFPVPDKKSIQYVSSNAVSLEYVQRSRGIGIIPDYLLDDTDMEGKGLKYVLEDFFFDPPVAFMDTLYVCYSKLTVHEKLILEFVDSFKQYLRRIGKIVL